MEKFRKGAIALTLVLVTAFFLQPYRPIVVRGASMEPALKDGQLIFAKPMKAKPQRGDLVVFERDGSLMVKRVAMVGGDKWTEVKLPYTAFWTMVDTPRFAQLLRHRDLPTRKVAVPDDQLFVVGDNDAVSIDSRTFGPIPLKSVRGIVELRL